MRETRFELPEGCRLADGTLRLMQGDPNIPHHTAPEDFLFLDTETTGLSHGAGTVAFLVGVGVIEDGGLTVRQYLMRDYDEEGFVLRRTLRDLDACGVLVTFNGRSFDMPLLETRFVMQRMRTDTAEIPHADLLHTARRVWKLRLKRCNLASLEELIFHEPREDDLPGSEVPARYFAYLKTRQEELLKDVLEHNAQDIASLCVLLNHMAYLYLHPEKIAFSEDVYSMGRALEKTRHPEEARRCYTLAREGRMGTDAGRALAASHRRSGEREEAARVWREMIACRQGGAEPYIELAKYEEHVRKDPAAALRLTEQALALLSEPGLENGFAVQEAKNEVQYRYQRLKRKLKEQRP